MAEPTSKELADQMADALAKHQQAAEKLTAVAEGLSVAARTASGELTAVTPRTSGPETRPLVARGVPPEPLEEAKAALAAELPGLTPEQAEALRRVVNRLALRVYTEGKRVGEGDALVRLRAALRGVGAVWAARYRAAWLRTRATMPAPDWPTAAQLAHDLHAFDTWMTDARASELAEATGLPLGKEPA